MDKVAVVILNWNGSAMMKKFLPGVCKYSIPQSAVYVADNFSTDDSLAMLAECFPQVKVIQLDRNYGFAEGYNQALRRIEAEYYVLLNSDVEINSYWLTPMLDYMDSHPDTGACQPKLLSQIQPDKFEYAGASGGYIDSLGYPYCRGRIFDTVESDNGQYDDVTDIFWATGAALMVRASLYHKLGGLDGRFFAHMEEIDFCWRMKSAGYEIVCIPQSVVYHVGGGTLPKENPHKTYLNFRNNLYMLYKNLPGSLMHKVMFARIWLDMLAAFVFLAKGETGSFKAVFRAYGDFLRNRRDMQLSRKEIAVARVKDNLEKDFCKSILWHYHIKGNKTFSKIKKQ